MTKVPHLPQPQLLRVLNDTRLAHGRLALFDGVCNLCNSTVQFILKHDKRGLIQFAPLQQFIPNEPLASILYFRQGKLYAESTAVLHILRDMGGIWPALGTIGLFFPRPIRDAVYRFVGRNRYRWFGRTEQCMLPRPEWKPRFVAPLSPEDDRHRA